MLVITISDRAYNKVYEDLSGEAIISILRENNIESKKIILPDDYDLIVKTFSENLSFDYIITTGGTGMSKRDITPEATKFFTDKEVPGISEYLRMKSLEETPYAVFSRGYSGIKENTVIMNFPGSFKAAEFCMRLILPLLEHGVKMLAGGGH